MSDNLTFLGKTTRIKSLNVRLCLCHLGFFVQTHLWFQQRIWPSAGSIPQMTAKAPSHLVVIVKGAPPDGLRTYLQLLWGLQCLWSTRHHQWWWDPRGGPGAFLPWPWGLPWLLFIITYNLPPTVSLLTTSPHLPPLLFRLPDIPWTRTHIPIESCEKISLLSITIKWLVTPRYLINVKACHHKRSWCQ